MVKKCARELKEGDKVDLENDCFADPKGENVSYQFEYAIVASIEMETAKCVLVHFHSTPSVGFPPDHKLEVCA